jgi:hypothetical protein
MPLMPERSVPLWRHPDSGSGPVRGIEARVRRAGGGALVVAFSIDGDMGRVRVPEPRQPRFADGLWEHTCCEVFVARSGHAPYHEFNLSPSGEWAAYAFRAYRERTELDAAALSPAISVLRSARSLQLTATLRLGLLSRAHLESRLALGLSAVIEQADGALSYWALEHPPGPPDFHRPDAFALAIE